MSHVVLLGDSIFDNARYVPGGPSVIQHLGKCLPPGWRATLLAIDGALVEDVASQLAKLPPDATHLVVSAGGNDALDHSGFILDEPATSVAGALAQLGDIRLAFQQRYRGMLQRLQTLGKPTTLCTIYDSIPGLSRAEHTGLCVFNDVILREAVRAGPPVIDLRSVCSESSDYAPSSPIEPSVSGGGKIARAVRQVVTSHDYASGRCCL